MVSIKSGSVTEARKESNRESWENSQCISYKNENTGSVALFGRRAPHESLRSNALLDPAVAEFSHVTITNSANITLVQHLTMQALLHHNRFLPRPVCVLIMCIISPLTPPLPVVVWRTRMSHLWTIALRKVLDTASGWSIMARF